jgi:hypothetical protein
MPVGYGVEKHSAAGAQQFFRAAEVIFGIDADCVEWSFRNHNLDPVFEKAKLLQALGALKLRFRQRDKAVEGGFAVSVKAEVLEISNFS